MVPLVGDIFAIYTNFITNCAIANEIGTNGKSFNEIGEKVQMSPANRIIGKTLNTCIDNKEYAIKHVRDRLFFFFFQDS